eukprot:gene34647-39174_t
MAVEPAEHWASEGVALLRHASALGPIRFVVPGFESERLDAALDLGLEPDDIWWHRDLEPFTGLNVVSEHKSVSVEGAEGRLVPAPPVYDPGGPVLLVTSVVSPEALRRVEQSAARRGARVSVVPQPPADTSLATLLNHAGYTLTTFFFSTPADGAGRTSGAEAGEDLLGHLAEQHDLLVGERVEEGSAHGPDVGRCRLLDGRPTDGGEDDEGASSVVEAVLLLDQAAARHARHVVRETTTLPLQGLGELRDPHATSVVVGELHQHVEVRQRELRVPLELAVEQRRELGVERQPPAPGLLLGVG